MGSNLENNGGDETEDHESEDRSNFSAPRLVEGVRDLLLRWFKEAHHQKPWPQMSEADQRVWIGRIEERAHKLVDDVIEVVNHGDFPVINAQIESFTVKAGSVKVVTKGFAENEMLAILNSAGEKRVQITVMRNDQFNQAMDPLNPDPDQPGLPGVKMNDEPGFEEDPDDLYETAVEFVRKQTKVGASLLQRHLSIGFNRATEILARMEEDGIVSPANDKGGRTVLVSAEPDVEQAEGAEILTPKSEQWRGGFNSRMGAIPRGQNPFNPGAKDFDDWFAGWDAADFDDAAPVMPATEEPPVEEPAVEVEKPKAPNKRKPKAGPIVAPDIKPEEEVPGDQVKADADVDIVSDITDQTDTVIESDEQAYAFGRWCRSDGKGTGSNPFPTGSDFWKQWTRGYGDERRDEATRPKDDDQF